MVFTQEENEMTNEKMITRLVFDADKKRMVLKKFFTPIVRKVFFSTQGSKTPHSLNTEGKGIVEIFDDHKGDRLGWCSSERDKQDVLYSVYGRTNVRFDS